MTESSGLPPEQEAVRRLLADARHDGPPPPEVVARLDDTLASLAAERATPAATPAAMPAADDSPGRLVDLGSRRRRRASIGLLAAASVVVAGVALGQVLPRGAGDAGESSAGSSSDTSLAEAPEPGAGAADEGGDEGGGASSDAGGAAAEPSPESARSSPATPFAGVPTFSSADVDLEAQVLAARPEASSRRDLLTSLDAVRGCGVPRPARAAALVPAEVDGRPGVVVFARPVGEAQRVTLHVCGEPDPVRTLTVPAP